MVQVFASTISCWKELLSSTTRCVKNYLCICFEPTPAISFDSTIKKEGILKGNEFILRWKTAIPVIRNFCKMKQQPKSINCFFFLHCCSRRSFKSRKSVLKLPEMIAVSLRIMQYLLSTKVIGQRLGHEKLLNQKLPSSFIAF